MAAGIEGNPDQLEAAASRIRRAAATVDGSADDLRARTRSVLGGWRGAAADAYQGHAGRTADHLEGVARIAGAAPAVLVDYADQLRAAQRAFADAHAAHLAAGRRYDHARADQAAARHDADAARLAGEIAADAARARHHAAAAMTTAKQRAHAANEDAAGAITTLTWQIDPSAAHATPHFTAPGGATIDAFRPGDDWHGTRPTNLGPALRTGRDRFDTVADIDGAVGSSMVNGRSVVHLRRWNTAAQTANRLQRSFLFWPALGRSYKGNPAYAQLGRLRRYATAYRDAARHNRVVLDGLNRARTAAATHRQAFWKAKPVHQLGQRLSQAAPGTMRAVGAAGKVIGWGGVAMSSHGVWTSFQERSWGDEPPWV